MPTAMQSVECSLSYLIYKYTYGVGTIIVFHFEGEKTESQYGLVHYPVPHGWMKQY